MKETGAEIQKKEEEGMKLKREQGGKARQGTVGFCLLPWDGLGWGNDMLASVSESIVQTALWRRACGEVRAGAGDPFGIPGNNLCAGSLYLSPGWVGMGSSRCRISFEERATRTC